MARDAGDGLSTRGLKGLEERQVMSRMGELPVRPGAAGERGGGGGRGADGRWQADPAEVGGAVATAVVGRGARWCGWSFGGFK